MPIRHNSVVLVIIWPKTGLVEVTQVTAQSVIERARSLGAVCEVVRVQANTPESVKAQEKEVL
jgi:hypothetical protein